MIVRTKKQLKKQAACLAGEIFDILKAVQSEHHYYNFTICNYYDMDSDEAEIHIRMHNTDDLMCAREQNAIKRGEL